MENNIFYTNTFKKKGIKTYVMTICQDLEKIKKNLEKNLGIQKFPKKIFEKHDENYKKYLYLDDYEILFLNNQKKCSNEVLYTLFGELGVLMRKNDGNVFIYLESNDEIILKNQIVSYILGLYQIQKFKTDYQKNICKTYFYHSKNKYKTIINEAIYIASIQNEVRTLTNIPCNILHSSSYKKYISTNLNKNSHLKMSVYNEIQLKKMGFNLILAVNKGSNHPALLIKLEYKKNIKKNEKPIVFVGKGVMFDSGGLNLKGGDFSDMKNDMNGSAIVYGLMQLISNSEINGHFIGLLPIVENMVDSKSTRPGDIITSYNKKTVEIIDTDAEGRLIMADCLAFSKNFKPCLVIDIATLTGDAVNIFGGKSTVIMGNDNESIQKMIQNGIKNNEKLWEMPMWKEYIELTKSNIADYKNYSYGAQAGAIMAGAFLSNFIPKDTKWIHLDVAGVDNLIYDTNTRSFGSSGEILRTLYSFIKKNSLF
jgi:leucyl aminopeptidase